MQAAVMNECCVLMVMDEVLKVDWSSLFPALFQLPVVVPVCTNTLIYSQETRSGRQ